MILALDSQSKFAQTVYFKENRKWIELPLFSDKKKQYEFKTAVFRLI